MSICAEKTSNSRSYLSWKLFCNPTIDYRKQKRSNDTHQSKTDPLARLYKKAKGAEAKLAYLGHILTENRNGLVVNTRVTLATGTAERAAAIEMTKQIPGGSKRVTLGADRGYDTADFVEQMKEFRVTPLRLCSTQVCSIPALATNSSKRLGRTSEKLISVSPLALFQTRSAEMSSSTLSSSQSWRFHRSHVNASWAIAVSFQQSSRTAWRASFDSILSASNAISVVSNTSGLLSRLRSICQRRSPS